MVNLINIKTLKEYNIGLLKYFNAKRNKIWIKKVQDLIQILLILIIEKIY
jgi:hypothetical protein